MVESDGLIPSYHYFLRLKRILDLDLIAVREIIGRQLQIDTFNRNKEDE